MGKIFQFGFSTAALLVGSMITAATISAIIARNFGIELPPAPQSVIDLYERVRDVIFVWAPDWWMPIWSDLLVIYFSINISIVRTIFILETDTSNDKVEDVIFLLALFIPLGLMITFGNIIVNVEIPRHVFARILLVSIFSPLPFIFAIFYWEWLQTSLGF